MAELLLELLSEEIPARMQERAAEDLRRLVLAGLERHGVTPSLAAAFATPRRLTLVAEGLPEHTPEAVTEIRGPRLGAPEAAVEGFLRANGPDYLEGQVRRASDQGSFPLR
jgi:glycyl-tRNA synthetase beta chain